MLTTYSRDYILHIFKNYPELYLSVKQSGSYEAAKGLITDKALHSDKKRLVAEVKLASDKLKQMQRDAKQFASFIRKLGNDIVSHNETSLQVDFLFCVVDCTQHKIKTQFGEYQFLTID